MQALASVQVAFGDDRKCVALENQHELMVDTKYNHRNYLANGTLQHVLLYPKVIPVVAYNTALTCIGVAYLREACTPVGKPHAATFLMTECIVHNALQRCDQDTVADLLVYEALSNIPWGGKVEALAPLPCPLLETSPSFYLSHEVHTSSHTSQGLFVHDGRIIPYAKAEVTREWCHRQGCCNAIADISCPGVSLFFCFMSSCSRLAVVVSSHLLQGCNAGYCSSQCLEDDAFDHRAGSSDAHCSEYDAHLIQHFIALEG